MVMLSSGVKDKGKTQNNAQRLEELAKAVKVATWRPYPHQQKVLDYLNAGKKVILLQGSNRIGKTVCGACIVGAACYGQQPWDGNPTVWGDRPVRVRIICVDWEHHAKEVVVPVLKEWLPVGTYETKKNNIGVDAFWTFPNGSTIELMTHIQDTKIHEGWKGDLVWSDEPLPKDKFVANRRGLIDNSGVFLLTMTAVYEPWIMDDIALADGAHIGCVTEIPMNANPLLTQEDIESYAKDVPEEQREARISGGWWQLAGKVIKGFNTSVHVVDDFRTPVDWPVVALIDLHLNTPQAVGFYAWDKYDRLFAVDEIWENASPEQIADEIVRRKSKDTLRISDVYIDPLSKGDSAFVKNRYDIEDSYQIIERRLRPHGMMLHVASKDKSSGVRNIQDRIKGANGMPSLFMQRKCKRHIYEIQRWVYDENGQPKKENDHFMENLYRATLTGTKFSDPVGFNKPLKFGKTGVI